jgi:hypothetical protein
MILYFLILVYIFFEKKVFMPKYVPKKNKNEKKKIDIFDLDFIPLPPLDDKEYELVFAWGGYYYWSEIDTGAW